MISEFKDESWARWNLAHELGHRFNLYDVIQADNLMQADEFPGNVDYKVKNLPTNLTGEQVLITRDWAYKVYCSGDICIRND